MKGHYYIDGPGLHIQRLYWTKAEALEVLKELPHDKWGMLWQAGLFSTLPSGKVMEHGKIYALMSMHFGVLRPVKPLENYTHRK